ncbi:MAG: hypothetical protein R2852_08940 [Bacteroidia bacterium]
MTDIEKSIELLQNPWAYRNRGLIYLAKEEKAKLVLTLCWQLKKASENVWQ